VPIYEYKCDECRHQLEKLTKFSAPDPWCPKCTTPMKKLVSASSFSLKGSGWYSDGYSSSPKDGMR